jgi:Xaa-Pro aminopeptidase
VIDLDHVRAQLRERGLGAWVLYDFRGSNPVLWHVLGSAPRGTTRRLVLVVPADGEPALVCSALDEVLVGGLGVPLAVYRRRQELTAELERRLAGAGRVAMEYSPGGELPIASFADAGAVDLVRGLGVEVVSSGDLFAAVAAAWDERALASHREAARHVVEVRDLAFAHVRDRLGAVREAEVADLVVAEFARRGLATEGLPSVAAGPHASNQHHEPGDAAIGPDQVLLLDLWARLPGEGTVFADVTWMAFTGREPPPAVRAVFDAVAAGRDAALTLLEDGRTHRGFEVDRACRAAIEAAGYGHGLVHRTGHSLSPGPHVHGLGPNLDDWETHDDRVLAPGAGFTVEPGVYLPEFGIRLECDVHLRADGRPEVTTPLQTELTRLH